MSTLLIHNAAVIGPAGGSENASVVISEGLISDVSEKGQASAHNSIDAGGLRLFPGFVDVHIHGAVGVDVNEADADGLLAIAEFLAGKGVTSWVPTLVPDSDANYRRIIGEIDRLMEVQIGRPVAQAVGVHYEGVFANEKMCGALRPEFFKKFTGNELAELPRLQRGVHMMTMAPEIAGGVELVREASKHGWVVSVGHTRASTEVLDDAFAAGARHLTHFYNAMTGLHHRDVGVVGWALTSDGVTFDIIADGMHVAPEMLAFACRSKGPENVSLISDSVAPAGIGDGEFRLWGETITVENGITRNERGSIAGSVITMLDAVNTMRSLGFPDGEVSQMASLNPARLLGLEKVGSIEAGKRADLVALDAAGNAMLVMIGGQIVIDRLGERSAIK